MNREERKERRQRELKQAVIVFAIMICIVLALVLGGILIVQKLLPQKPAGGQNTETTEVSTEMRRGQFKASYAPCGRRRRNLHL